MDLHIPSDAGFVITLEVARLSTAYHQP